MRIDLGDYVVLGAGLLVISLESAIAATFRLLVGRQRRHPF